jgi:hypothetical protein
MMSYCNSPTQLANGDRVIDVVPCNETSFVGKVRTAATFTALVFACLHPSTTFRSSYAAINTWRRSSLHTQNSGPLPTKNTSSLFNAHRSAAPDKAASFKSLYLIRPHSAEPLPGFEPGDPDTALRLIVTNRVFDERLGDLSSTKNRS